MSYRVQDNSSEWSTPDTCKVYVPTSTIKAMAVTVPDDNIVESWTNEGGASSIVTAVGDASDATYGQSDTSTANPSALRLRLYPLFEPSAFSMTLRTSLSAAGTGTTTVRLYEGTTVRKTWTIVPSTTLADSVVTLTTAEIDTVTSWLDLDVDVAWEV
jgi:hypothetical protein